MTARILRFALEDLRRAHGARVPPGADPRTDTAPFRAFRERLLDAAARAAVAPADLAMWWEGTYNGYALAVAVTPPDALPSLDAGAAAPVEDDRIAEPRPGGYPLAHVEPGRSQVARDAGGATWEAPFGAATGHFGAPGMRRVP